MSASRSLSSKKNTEIIPLAEGPISPYYTSSIEPQRALHYHNQSHEIQLYGKANRFNNTTGYHDEYRAWDLPKREPPPPVQPHPTVPFDAHSSYKDDYPAHQIQPRAPHEPAQYRDSGIKFDATSSYQQDYPAHHIDPRQPPPPVKAVKNDAKFDGTTTYGLNYPAHKIEPRSRHEPAPYQPNNVPWEATTAYADAYKAHELPKREPAPPMQRPKSLPFEGTTSNRDDYKAYAIEPKQAAKVEYKYDPLPFEGQSESHEAYKQWELEKRPPPPPVQMRPSVPFEGSTTNQDAYKPFEIPKRRPPLGIAMVHDQMFNILPGGPANEPASNKQIFTTVHDNQKEVCLMIYQGDNPTASKNVLLGQFQMVGLPEQPYGVPQIEVTFTVDKNMRFSVEARDLDSERHEAWLFNGGAIVANGFKDRQMANGLVQLTAMA